MRAVSAFARAKGIDCKVRGTQLIIEGEAFTTKEMNNLPHDLSIENAKVVAVEDGTAFQGRHAYLSNYHPCKITWDNKEYHCSEQMFQYTRAIENDQGGVARKIYETQDLKVIISLSKQIKDTPT